MALITVSGAVDKVFYNGKAAAIVESYTNKDGEERKSRYTCWFDDVHGLTVGEIVTVRGYHSVAVEEWTDQFGAVKHTAKVNVNSAYVTGDAPSAADYEAALPDVPLDEDAPF